MVALTRRVEDGERANSHQDQRLDNLGTELEATKTAVWRYSEDIDGDSSSFF